MEYPQGPTQAGCREYDGRRRAHAQSGDRMVRSGSSVLHVSAGRRQRYSAKMKLPSIQTQDMYCTPGPVRDDTYGGVPVHRRGIGIHAVVREYTPAISNTILRRTGRRCNDAYRMFRDRLQFDRAGAKWVRVKVCSGICRINKIFAVRALATERRISQSNGPTKSFLRRSYLSEQDVHRGRHPS